VEGGAGAQGKSLNQLVRVARLGCEPNDNSLQSSRFHMHVSVCGKLPVKLQCQVGHVVRRQRPARQASARLAGTHDLDRKEIETRWPRVS
jgi:hypothetical protein